MNINIDNASLVLLNHKIAQADTIETEVEAGIETNNNTSTNLNQLKSLLDIVRTFDAQNYLQIKQQVKDEKYVIDTDNLVNSIFAEVFAPEPALS